MARLVIYCPLLDLQFADGKPLPPAQATLASSGTDEEKAAQLAALRKEIGAGVVKELRDSLQLLAMLQPGFRALADQGVYVVVEDDAGPYLPLALAAVPEEALDEALVASPKGAAKCAGRPGKPCGEPATGFQIVYECRSCHDAKAPLVVVARG